jgi:hypothetical protein
VFEPAALNKYLPSSVAGEQKHIPEPGTCWSGFFVGSSERAAFLPTYTRLGQMVYLQHLGEYRSPSLGAAPANVYAPAAAAAQLLQPFGSVDSRHEMCAGRTVEPH